MIHLALVVLAVLFLARVGLGLIVGTTIYLDEHPRFAKRLGWSLAGLALAFVCLIWWLLAPAGFYAALVWTAIIGTVIFVWKRLERRRP